MIEEWVKDLTSGSLQSFEELSKIQENFNIPTSDVIKNQQILKDIFITRNQISHEMDIDLESGTGRNQHPRKMELMKTYTQEIFNICIKFIEKVEEKLVLDDLDLHESENGFYISA
jgi:hypothetical protein